MGLAGLMFAACGDDGGKSPDAGFGDGDGGGGDGNSTYVKPQGYASVTFFVDDTANQTYGSGDIQWKGSFIYSENGHLDGQNILEYDAAWAAEVGPYPVLYDDGPIAVGGHEMPGATAGDHIFSVEVYVKADDSFETEFQYGAINEFGNWIWEGANGEFTLAAGTTDRIDAQGYYIHQFGTYDLKVALDTSLLNPDFLPFDPASDRIYLKGSMNSWDKRQLLDNGEKGDVSAGDGIYTYWHAQNLGDHDGMLYAGQHVQFVFMLNDLEYKKIDALSDGVTSWTNCAGPEDWAEVPIFMEVESRGRIKNTTVAVCEGGGGLSVTSLVPPVGDVAGGTAVAVYGAGFEDGAQVTFGGEPAGDIQFVDAGQISCSTPAHAAGSVTVRVTNPGGDFGELPNGFEYVQGDQPEVLFVDPQSGPPAGGTPVTITGQRFAAGVQVTFGGEPAGDVTVVSDQQITCLTPAHPLGRVAVVVTNPGGLSATFPEGFEYAESIGPRIDWLEPSTGSTLGGDQVIVHGGGFDVGATVHFDVDQASDVVVNPPGEIICRTPAHAEGAVDVRVVNSDAQEAVLAGGFTYQKPAVDWAILQWPQTMTVTVDQPSEPVYGRVYEPGMTEGDVCPMEILAQLGYGPSDSIPADDPGSWTWTDAACNDSCTDCGNNDEHIGTLTISQSGIYAYACRFSMDAGDTWVYADGNGSQDGYQPEHAGSVTVRGGGDQLEIWEINPPAGTILGGTELAIMGNAFQDGALVSLDGIDLATIFGDQGHLMVTTPAHASGAVDVTVTNPDANAITLPGGFHFVLRHSPAIDGMVGSDWGAEFLAGENASGSDWGLSNFLDQMYVAFDDDNLYLGFTGLLETTAGNPNVIVAYLDTDFGTGTGVANMNQLTDNSGLIDNAISSVCAVSAPGFGAEFAVATQGMSGVDAGTLSEGAGLRRITDPADFAWLEATVGTSLDPAGVEVALPWSVLLGGFPANGAQLAVFARLCNYDGQYFSNDTLPLDDPLAPESVTEVFAFEVR